MPLHGPATFVPTILALSLGSCYRGRIVQTVSQGRLSGLVGLVNKARLMVFSNDRVADTLGSFVMACRCSSVLRHLMNSPDRFVW
jgi:hypothetical protein